MSYITKSDIEIEFGTTNVAVWSNLDNDSEVANESRIARAIEYAESEVENYFRNGKYIVPFIATSGELTPVKDWCAKLAGMWLYEGRGAYAEGGEDTNRYAKLKASVYSKMSMYANGVYSLNAQKLASGTPNAPVVV
jgi:phage gp36-like protein